MVTDRKIWPLVVLEHAISVRCNILRGKCMCQMQCNFINQHISDKCALMFEWVCLCAVQCAVCHKLCAIPYGDESLLELINAEAIPRCTERAPPRRRCVVVRDTIRTVVCGMCLRKNPTITLVGTWFMTPLARLSHEHLRPSVVRGRMRLPNMLSIRIL